MVAHKELPPVTCDVQRPVATITMTTPALTLAAKQHLLAALERVAADDDVRAVVLSGTGRVFSVGQDLAEHARALRAEDGAAFATLDEHYNPIVTLLATMPKPVLAAINGTCAGAGIGLALACDLRIAAADARFATAFTGIGLTPDSGLSASLSRALGTARASALTLLNKPFSADEALAWGLVGEVVPAGEVSDRSAALAVQLAAGPTLAYATAKRAVREAWALPLPQVLATETADQAALGATTDHRNAVEAFLDKRTPTFLGR